MKRSEETRRRISAVAIQRAAEKVYTKGIGGHRQDLGHYVRSSWEANVARIFKLAGAPYIYEGTSFVLYQDGHQIAYRPDFTLDHPLCRQIPIEVKGWWTERSKLIRRLMEEQYPETQIIYIDQKSYELLKVALSSSIPEWEYKRARKEASGHG